jgi:nucleoid-associated protein YgaU
MKQNQIQDLEKLREENFENIFNVYQDQDGMYFYNLLQTVVFPQDLPPSLFTTYVIAYGDTWPFISFKTLKSPNLWWLILLANGIQNPLEPLVNGTKIKIPIDSVVKEVITQIGRR